jgi:proline iminopeptidase
MRSHTLRISPSLILSSTVADMPQLRAELDRLKAALGPEAMAMMQRHEAQGHLHAS